MKTGNCSRQDARASDSKGSGSLISAFFAAFAPLREIFRFLVAASPRRASVVKISSHKTRKNLKWKVVTGGDRRMGF